MKSKLNSNSYLSHNWKNSLIKFLIFSIIYFLIAALISVFISIVCLNSFYTNIFIISIITLILSILSTFDYGNVYDKDSRIYTPIDININCNILNLSLVFSNIIIILFL